MKSIFLFLTVAFLHICVITGMSQSITLNEKQASLYKIFTAIEKQTDFVIFYNKEHLQNTIPVSVNVRNMALPDFLSVVLKNEPLTYEISQKNILIKKKPDPPGGG